MGEYRLYFLDERGHIKRPLDLESDSDEHALALAQGHPHQHSMELWEGKRLVGRILAPPTDDGPEGSG